ncbi:hypothetical protein J4E93_010230 [Alternaria ventricosa]|uniref:uncharacterized protein n=1 Tax=Alternaria ventricosa TaxID=1187951 RepID=UPI0020C52CCC|nr:uncharacterized protein J4E93_010230 [Alternaria ventricosa]KAI4638231.1 hypothetical protein J4E93_010230 [Alternaria ventricosa]
MTSTTGIPPPEVRVRILNMKSRRALYSATRDTNALNHVDSTTIYSDQYWYIQPGKGKHQGRYLVVNAANGRALYANNRNGANGGNGEVGTMDNPGSFDDHHFDLAQTQGTGVRNNQFRLHTPTGHANFFSRTDHKPELGCLSDKEKIYDDHWFTFELEPLEFVRIKYDEEHPEIITTGIRHFPPQKALNHLEIETTQEMTISQETEQQSTFTSEIGVSVTASAEFSCGVPLFAEGKVSISTTLSTSLAWGTTNITRQKWEAKVVLKCPPKSATLCTASVLETRLRMPFVSYWKTEKGGKEVQLKGVYEGQSCASLSTVSSHLPYTPEKK